MIDVLGSMYYLDLEELESFIELDDVKITKDNDKIEGDGNVTVVESGQRFSVIKFDIIKMMIEVVITEREEFDENLGSYQAKKTSIPFRVAFNTLLRYNIIKSLN
jgi:predicted nucleic-acid-binding protein|tara:strand:+ start:2193 stop:2507 length:315 start_codon:yes stop_codon:yes gene_type:complete